MGDFKPLRLELDRWQEMGRVADFWWRDDDAEQVTPALRKLLQLSEKHCIPLALASVPQGIETRLADSINELPLIAILQHGYSHRNYAPQTEKKQELGAHRQLTDIADELRCGYGRLQQLFGRRFVPVLVPPWNRIAPDLCSLLPGLGFRGLSVSGPRAERYVLPSLRQVNVHVDIIDWRGSRGFVGNDRVVQQSVEHLVARRLGKADRGEATGLMTHHLVHDDGCWKFLDRLLPFLAEHPAARFLTAGNLFHVEP